MKRFLNAGLWISSLMGLSVWTLPVWAKALVPVSQLTITAQDQQVLRAALPHDTESVTTLLWQGDPLTLTLPLQQEQRLIFPEPVQVDINGQLTTEQLRVINDHRNVYLTALMRFEKTARMYITLKNSGQIIFLDVATTDQSRSLSAKVIHIELAPTLKSANRSLSLKPSTATISHTMRAPIEASGGLAASDLPFFSASADDLVQTSRFAWQQLYAPSYLISNETGFMRSPMHTRFWISGLLYSDAVFAHPVASWMREDVFVTAVELRNPYAHPATLDLARDLCGNWRAAMLYPRTVLQSAGHKPDDSTTLFLISSESFDHVWGGCHHGRT